MRVLVTCEYDGGKYFGWQKQVNEISVQSTIENVISKILNCPTVIHGSGRTDAGVHAHGQTFHFDINKTVDINQLLYSCNCLLPKDIRLKSIIEVDDDFHARISAKEKTYVYRIKIGKSNVFEYPYVEEILVPFDEEKFARSLSLFVGEHDFRNFTSKEEEEGFSFVRHIYNINIEKEKDIISISLNGNGFMRYMIRFIVGTCIAFAKGQIDEEYILSRIDSKDRKISCNKANSKGLFLKEVKY